MKPDEKKEAARIDKLGNFMQMFSRVVFFVQIVFLVLALVCTGWPMLFVISPILIWAVVWIVIMVRVCLSPKQNAK